MASSLRPSTNLAVAFWIQAWVIRRGAATPLANCAQSALRPELETSDGWSILPVCRQKPCGKAAHDASERTRKDVAGAAARDAASRREDGEGADAQRQSGSY